MVRRAFIVFLLWGAAIALSPAVRAAGGQPAGCGAAEKGSGSPRKARIALITVDRQRLKEYNALLREEIEASMRLEPGVLMLYAVSEKERPERIMILEIYADEQAYRRHIETPHFKKYKEGTGDMVQSLELRDAAPLMPELEIKK